MSRIETANRAAGAAFRWLGFVAAFCAFWVVVALLCLVLTDWAILRAEKNPAQLRTLDGWQLRGTPGPLDKRDGF